MVLRLAIKLSNYLMEQTAATDDEREIIAYGLFHILSDGMQIIILFIMGVLFQTLAEIFAFTACFTTIKTFAGGSHANAHWKCVTAYTITANIVAYLCQAKGNLIDSYMVVIMAFATLAIVFLKAPVPHGNNPKPEYMLKRLRQIATATACVQFCIFVVLISAGIGMPILLSGASGGFIAAATLIQIKKRKEANP